LPFLVVSSKLGRLQEEYQRLLQKEITANMRTTTASLLLVSTVTSFVLAQPFSLPDFHALKPRLPWSWVVSNDEVYIFPPVSHQLLREVVEQANSIKH